MNSRRQAFTLLEMLLVVFILAALAATTSSMVDNAHDQARYDDTKARLAQVRRAIVGVEDLSVAASGYTADVGEPPTSVRDLLRRRPVHPTDPGVVTVPAFMTAHDPDGTNDNLLYLPCGWRGPYLRSDPSQTLEFRDGWANLDDPAPLAPDELPGDPNFGWRWLVETPSGAVIVASRGADGVDDGAPLPEDPFSRDVLEPITVEAHHVDLADWSVVVTVVLTPDDPDASETFEILLRLWWPDPAGPNGLAYKDSEPHSLEYVPDTASPDHELIRHVKFEFPSALWTPPGSNWVSHGVRCLELRRKPTPASTSYAALNPRQQVLVDLRARAALPTSVKLPMVVH